MKRSALFFGLTLLFSLSACLGRDSKISNIQSISGNHNQSRNVVLNLVGSYVPPAAGDYFRLTQEQDAVYFVEYKVNSIAYAYFDLTKTFNAPLVPSKIASFSATDLKATALIAISKNWAVIRDESLKYFSVSFNTPGLTNELNDVFVFSSDYDAIYQDYLYDYGGNVLSIHDLNAVRARTVTQIPAGFVNIVKDKLFILTPDRKKFEIYSLVNPMAPQLIAFGQAPSAYTFDPPFRYDNGDYVAVRLAPLDFSVNPFATSVFKFVPNSTAMDLMAILNANSFNYRLAGKYLLNYFNVDTYGVIDISVKNNPRVVMELSKNSGSISGLPSSDSFGGFLTFNVYGNQNGLLSGVNSYIIDLRSDKVEMFEIAKGKSFTFKGKYLLEFLQGQGFALYNYSGL